MITTVLAPPSTTMRMGTFIDRLQGLAGRVTEVSSLTVVSELNQLVAELPRSLSRAEELMITGVLGHFLARFVRVAGVEHHFDVARGFLNLVDACPNLDAWRARWFQITARCAALLSHDRGGRAPQIPDTRVTHMLQIVETEFINPKLTMRMVAQAINVCPSHAARMLKRQTGFGFLTHLHRCRIAAARRLLIERPLSIKEISAAVGYTHSSQFSRRFKAACGTTPSAFRVMRISESM